jgi:hypothetical protein
MRRRPERTTGRCDARHSTTELASEMVGSSEDGPMATQPAQPTDRSLFEDFDERDTFLLKQAVEKLVRFGHQVGVTPEEMISLLDSGIRMHDLLAFLGSKGSGAA